MNLERKVKVSKFTGGAYADMKDVIESEMERIADAPPVAEDARVSETVAIDCIEDVLEYPRTAEPEAYAIARQQLAALTQQVEEWEAARPGLCEAINTAEARVEELESEVERLKGEN